MMLIGGFVEFSLLLLVCLPTCVQGKHASTRAVLFSAFIVYDTHQIMTRMGCDDYVIACIELYLDIINLFLMILELLGGGKR